MQQRTVTIAEHRTETSRRHDGQVAAIGYSDHGIHLTLSPAAASALVAVLLAYDASTGLNNAHRLEAEAYDSDFWNNVAVDLLAAKAFTEAHSAQDIVYARLISGPPTAEPTGPLLELVNIAELADELEADLALGFDGAGPQSVHPSQRPGLRRVELEVPETHGYGCIR